MNEQELTQHIEALLFTIGGPLSRKELMKRLGAGDEELSRSLALLHSSMSGRGVTLVDDGNEVELRTSPLTAATIEQIRREDFSRDIGRAGLEVLAAIMYRGPLSRSEIDFIRGVNSSQTVRTLLMRGFVRRVPNPRDERSFLYEPTTEILSQLGITHMNELPQFEEIKTKLAELEASYRHKEEGAQVQPQ